MLKYSKEVTLTNILYHIPNGVYGSMQGAFSTGVGICQVN